MNIKTISKKIKKNPLFVAIVGNITYIAIRILFWTYRLQIEHDKDLQEPLSENQGVFYFWHQNIIAGSTLFFKKKFFFHCVVSPSGDGKFVAKLTKKLGLKVVHGSAHKETLSLVRNSLKILKEHKQLFLIGDGSRGPAKKLKPGITYLSEKSRMPIIFISCKPQWKITLKKSWDQFQIPLPFSKIHITLTKFPQAK